VAESLSLSKIEQMKKPYAFVTGISKGVGKSVAIKLINAPNEKLGRHPDKVAEDIIRLTRKNRPILNSGGISKLLYVLNRISINTCFRLSAKRHREKV